MGTNQYARPRPDSMHNIGGSDLFEGNGQGQVFHSTDDGNTWTEVTNNLHPQAVNIGCLAFDGTNLLATDSDGGGIFLSTNKGTSWTAIKKRPDRPLD